MSGGERRRCEIARALSVGRKGPKYLLLDEPFAGIDPLAVGDLKKLIVKLSNAGVGILITDHNVRETLDVCERSYILNNSKIIAEGSSEDILENEEVKKVSYSKRKISHVITTKKTYDADYVVCSGDYHHFDQNILEEKYRNYSESYWNKRVLAPSSLLFYIGLDLSLIHI